MSNNNNNKTTLYPRFLSKAELSTPKNTKFSDYANTDETILETLTRKNYNYNSGYRFIMDALTAYITDNRESSLIHELENNYYSIRITPDDFENYSLGPYKTIKAINKQLWDNYKDVLHNQKVLIIPTDEKLYITQPIRILEQRSKSNINRHGGNINNLINQDATTAIDFIQIDFFKPLFRPVVENFNNFIILPRHLQAILEYTKLTHPELFEFKYFSRYDKDSGAIYKLSTQMVRKYFLFINTWTNFQGKNLNINKLKFWQSVNESRLIKMKASKFNPERYVEREPYKNKQYMDAFARLHNYLSKQGLLEGINFTTCQTFYNEDEYILRVYRKEEGKPLSNAPDYIQGVTELPSNS